MSSCLLEVLVGTTLFPRGKQRLEDGASALALGARDPGFPQRDSPRRIPAPRQMGKSLKSTAVSEDIAVFLFLNTKTVKIWPLASVKFSNLDATHARLKFILKVRFYEVGMENISVIYEPRNYWGIVCVYYLRNL